MSAEDHPVLDYLFDLLLADPNRNTNDHRDFRRESEGLEFRDRNFQREEQSKEAVWYEIVVRRVEGPCDEGRVADLERPPGAEKKAAKKKAAKKKGTQ